MKVYIIFYDNCEEYEDYEEWIEAVMSTEEKAKNYQPNEEIIGQFNRIEEFEIDEPSKWETIS